MFRAWPKRQFQSSEGMARGKATLVRKHLECSVPSPNGSFDTSERNSQGQAGLACGAWPKMAVSKRQKGIARAGWPGLRLGWKVAIATVPGPNGSLKGRLAWLEAGR